MRPDLDKVVTERPRYHHEKVTSFAKGYLRRLKIDENSPKREGMKDRWNHGDKEFTDLIGPLYKYLLKQVGRPWNKVFSEISKQLPANTMQGIHIRGHVMDFVETDVLYLPGDKTPRVNGGSYHGEPLESYRNDPDFFVNHAGILCQQKKRNRNKPKEITRLTVDDKCYFLVDEVWHEVTLRLKQWNDVILCGLDGKSGRWYDKVFDDYPSYVKYGERYGSGLVPWKHRLPSKKELIALGLCKKESKLPSFVR